MRRVQAVIQIFRGFLRNCVSEQHVCTAFLTKESQAYKRKDIRKDIRRIKGNYQFIRVYLENRNDGKGT